MYNTHPDHGGSSAGKYSGAKSDRRNNDYTPILDSILLSLGLLVFIKLQKSSRMELNTCRW